MNQTLCPHCGKGIAILKAAPAVEPKGVQAPTVQPDDNWLDEEPTTSKPAPRQAPSEQKVNLKLIRCNRCGEENLCWQESKNGKFYLCRTRMNGDTVIPLRKEFHQCSR